MATKPSAVPEFDTNDTDTTEPDAALKSDGFVDGAVIVTSYFNYLFLLLYQWILYLRDGYLTGAFGLASAISPTAITGTVNDYAPTDHATTQVIRQDLSGSTTLTGLDGGVAGRLVWLFNIDAAFKITLTDEDAGSTAGMRFALGGSSLILEPGGSAALWYDGTSSRWRVVASNKCSKEVTFYIPSQAGVLESGGWTLTSGYITPIAAANATYGLQLAAGDRIISVGAVIQADNANTLTLSLRRITAAGVASTRGTPDVSTTGGGTQFEALAVGDMTSEDVGTDGYYQISIDASASDADLQLYGVSVTVTRRIA